jgi:hypothetical protein
VLKLFENTSLLKKILEREVRFLTDRLKITTLLKFIKQWDKLLDSEKQDYNSPVDSTDAEEERLQYTLDIFDE